MTVKLIRGEIVDMPAHAVMGSEFIALGDQSGRQATILLGDVLDRLRILPDDSVQCVVTSPPYWGLRDYGIPASVWDGEPGCEHQWGDQIPLTSTSGLHRMPPSQTGGIKD